MDIKESIALSFLDPWECREFWRGICQMFHLDYQEDPYDMNEDNIEKINNKIAEAEEYLVIYSKSFLSDV